MVDLNTFPYTDLGNTERLVTLYGHEMRYCFAWNRWLIWDGTRWSTHLHHVPEQRAAMMVRAMFAEAGKMETEASQMDDDTGRKKLAAQAEEFSKFARKSEARARIVAAVEGAKAHLAIKPEDLDSDPDLLNCQNGTLHLPSGQLRPHSQADFITQITPVPYKPDTRLALWDQFLEDALPDPETRAYAQQVAGYSLWARMPEDIAVVCHGEGGTGKSTFVEAMKMAVGDYGTAADIGTFTTARDAHAPQPDLARLRSKRLVAIWEAETGGTVVKLLKAVSGHDEITTRTLHTESFSFVPTFTLWLRANKRPQLPHDDTGVWRRIREIPFDHVFKDPDRSIREVLTDPAQAGEAILAWMVRGFQMYRQRGELVAPETVTKATEAFREEMDLFRQWLEDCTNGVEEAWTPFKRLFESYKKFVPKDLALGRDKFSRRLEAEGYQRRNGGKNAAGFEGIALVDDQGYQRRGMDL